jgi:hypothetical protein
MANHAIGKVNSNAMPVTRQMLAFPTDATLNALFRMHDPLVITKTHPTIHSACTEIKKTGLSRSRHSAPRFFINIEDIESSIYAKVTLS